MDTKYRNNEDEKGEKQTGKAEMYTRLRQHPPNPIQAQDEQLKTSTGYKLNFHDVANVDA